MLSHIASRRLVHLGGIWYARSLNPLNPRPFAVLRWTGNRVSGTRVAPKASSPILRALPPELGARLGTREL